MSNKRSAPFASTIGCFGKVSQPDTLAGILPQEQGWLANKSEAPDARLIHLARLLGREAARQHARGRLRGYELVETALLPGLIPAVWALLMVCFQ